MTGSKLLGRLLCCLLSLSFINGVANDDVHGDAINTVKQDDETIRALTGPRLDDYLRRQIAALGLTGKPSSVLDHTDIKTSRIAQLGRELFFSKSLSGDFDVACASCHHPLLGGADGLSLPVGVGAIDTEVVGPGRQQNGDNTFDAQAGGGANVARNSPTTFNVALYKQALFYDGRIQVLANDIVRDEEVSARNGSRQPLVIQTPDSRFGSMDPEAGGDLLVAQGRFPVTALSEMRGYSHRFSGNNAHVREKLVQRLQGKTGELSDNRWLALFRWAFRQPQATPEELITFDTIARALAAYQRSQLFVDNPWNRWIKRQGTLSEEAKKGAALFFASHADGGADCVQCHSGDLLSNEQFYNLAMPQFGRGKASGQRDLGRYDVTLDRRDLYAFRVPSLLNVADTAPYGHTGAFISLKDVIQHHLTPADSLQRFDFTLQNLPQFRLSHWGLNRFAERNTNDVWRVYQKNPPVDAQVDTPLSEQDLAHLEAFLQTLTDPCIRSSECLEPWLPVGEAPDEHRLEAKLPLEFGQRAMVTVANAITVDRAQPPIPQPNTDIYDVDCAINEQNNKQEGFSDVTLQSGLFTRRYFSAESLRGGEAFDHSISFLKLIMSGGLAVGDIDGDCLTDLVIEQGDAGLTVYINQGEGRFAPVSDNWGLKSKHRMLGITLVDLNGDGWLDLFGSDDLGKKPVIFLNDGKGAFRPVTDAGFRTTRTTVGAGFGDIDRDGDLDAYLAHWDINSGGEEVHLWLNNGLGQFTAGADAFGLTGTVGEQDFTFTPNFADLNNDRLPDLAVTGDFLTSEYYINRHGRSLEQQTDRSVVQDANGMGAAIADFDNDGDLDWFVSSIVAIDIQNLQSDSDAVAWGRTVFRGNALYRNDGEQAGRLRLTDVSRVSGIADGGWGWGSCAADFNNDGWLDIFHVNGFDIDLVSYRKDLVYLFDLLGVQDFTVDPRHNTFTAFRESLTIEILPQQERDLKEFYYLALLRDAYIGRLDGFDHDESRLFINQQDGTFLEQAEHYGIHDAGQGRGVSCMDYDRDGDVDVLIANNTGSVALYRNNLRASGKDSSHFLVVKLLGDAPNRHAVGARIYLESASGMQMREVRVENNYLSQNALESHFGLGSDTVVNRLRVVWPDGSEEHLTNVGINQMLVLRKRR